MDVHYLDSDHNEALLQLVDIHIEEIERCAAAAGTRSLIPIANTFAKNLHDIHAMLSLPLLLLLAGTARSSMLLNSVISLIEREKNNETLDEAAEEEEINRLLEEEFRDEENARANYAKASLLLDRLLTNNRMRSAVHALLSATTTATWTAFEVLVTDLWVEALNQQPTELAQHVLSSIPSSEGTDGISKRSVSVGLLARYGFDLRSSMGTVLKASFDFTGVSGMHKAYATAFGMDTELKAIFDRQELRMLEAVRHLLVHRGGIIDESFKKRTGSHRPVNSLLPLDSIMVSAVANTVVAAGCQLICLVERRLNDHRDRVAARS